MGMISLPQDVAGKEVSRDRFEPFPAGEYVLEVAKIPPVQEGPSGDYVKWFFKVVEHEEYEGRWISHITSLKDDEEVLLMEGGIVDTLDCLGVELRGRSFDDAETVGKRLVADLVQETYQPDQGDERIQMKINKMYPLAE